MGHPVTRSASVRTEVKEALTRAGAVGGELTEWPFGTFLGPVTEGAMPSRREGDVPAPSAPRLPIARPPRGGLWL